MANYKEDIVSIELSTGTIHRSFMARSIGAGDEKADRFGIRAFRNGVPETLSGSCIGLFVRSDGTTVTITNGVVSGNMAYVTLPEACYVVEGCFCLAIKVITANDAGTMRIVDGMVSRTSTDVLVDPGTVITSIEDMIEAIEEAVASIPADYSDLWEKLAPNFNASASYKIGQYVTYDGGVYRFVNDHSGTWNSADVVSVDIGGELTASRKTRNVVSTVIDGLEQKNYRFPQRMTTDLLTLTDESGNILSKFDYKGHFISKDFEASRSVMRKYPYTPLIYDFAIQDEEGNVAFAIVNGLAITNQRLHGKKLAIVGDSISTYAGWIPEGYATYYPSGNLNDVYYTWWHKLIDELGLELIRNASWSGSSVSGDSQGTGFAACSDARINALEGDNGETPDIVIVYIGTNDWAGNVQIGSFTDKDEIPSEGVIYEISKAYALMLYKIRTKYPFADVYCVTSLEGRRTSGDTTYPIVNTNGDTIHDVNHAISEIAHIFGCKVIDLNICGIHFWNVSAYTTDGTLHPNRAGAEVIKEVVKQTLINNYHNNY